MPDLPAEGITNHAAVPTPFLIFVSRPSFSFPSFARRGFDVIEDSATVKLRYGSLKLSRWQNYTTNGVTTAHSKRNVTFPKEMRESF